MHWSLIVTSSLAVLAASQATDEQHETSSVETQDIFKDCKLLHVWTVPSLNENGDKNEETPLQLLVGRCATKQNGETVSWTDTTIGLNECFAWDTNTHSLVAHKEHSQKDGNGFRDGQCDRCILKDHEIQCWCKNVDESDKDPERMAAKKTINIEGKIVYKQDEGFACATETAQ
ncbi:hypothetical protein BDV32DRAFT_149660 [Aspergillus pseudonomiae]|uniref:Uncharacterized protein n=1 Tax=Aspergillus pseudonomiae TaxID=1506151 RepID=A0A5N7DL63_9EURO|nr:uncharacterized protein BDV37DRAFT_280091 [Aspergillus pseudonomiae]KAB8260178.1 hypothetical protein BDV32DRAFT_149660 [Aspergillus pseudonomiae]KAE8407180.1 hypothetical protein BDV37DRAFT_280091 [Aspergillus pseudonomiae]